MVSTRARSHNEAEDATNSVTNLDRVATTEVARPHPVIPQPPPLLRPLASIPVPRLHTIPPINLNAGGPLMTEAGSQDEFQIRFLQAMNSMMEQQHETMLKMFEERDASYRRHEATAENAVGGSGGTGAAPATEETPVTEVRRTGKGCSYKTFLCSKPPEFSGTSNPVVCMNWLQEIE